MIEAELKSQLLNLMPKYRAYRDEKTECDYELCMGKCPLVGMTANYAAKNKRLLQRLQPRVCIVEEAGELLESQLLACLASPKMEHLVLIGDHQQLRPKVSDYTLAQEYHLDISMFERLLKVGAPKAELSIQLRMRPSICDLVRPFYTSLEDHQRVFQHPPLRGVQKDVYFLRHRPCFSPARSTPNEESSVLTLSFSLVFCSD